MKELLVFEPTLGADADSPEMVNATHLILSEVLVPQCALGRFLSRRHINVGTGAGV